MEIERKYLITHPPKGYETHPSSLIEQAYLCTQPVIRIRKEDDQYYLTYKGKGLLAREEHNLPLTKDAYLHLLPKADGIVLTSGATGFLCRGAAWLRSWISFLGNTRGLCWRRWSFPLLKMPKISPLPPGLAGM